ncbi:hypothetical protein JSO56_06360 [Riemerella anatipestifer]|uniref:hypothetical protein n=1 Tax=Riemerella anatipestifer TaxID=34085 RepID=UPI0030BAAA3A
MTNETNILPVWYGGGMRKHLNALNGVGHLSRTGLIFLNIKNYDQKRNCRNHQRQTSRTRPVH